MKVVDPNISKSGEFINFFAKVFIFSYFIFPSDNMSSVRY